MQAQLYIYPNSGWSTVEVSKVNSLYGATYSGHYVEVGYFYDPSKGYDSTPAGITRVDDYYGETAEYWWPIPSGDVGRYKTFALYKSGVDDFIVKYGGQIMATHYQTGIQSLVA